MGFLSTLHPPTGRPVFPGVDLNHHGTEPFPFGSPKPSKIVKPGSDTCTESLRSYFYFSCPKSAFYGQHSTLRFK